MGGSPSDVSTNIPSNDVSTLCARLRRYLPYLGIYASDVRRAVSELERLKRELADATEKNAYLVEHAKDSVRQAVEYVKEHMS